MKRVTDHVLKPQLCLKCGHVVDRASGPGGRAPKDGDVTICVNCAHVMIFGRDLALRNPSPEELKDILSDPQTAIVVAALEEMNRQYPPKPNPEAGVRQ